MKTPFPIVVRGGGDLATGTIHKLYQAGFPVIVLETANPSAIRRYVAFSEAVYEGEWTVEGSGFCGSPGDFGGWKHSCTH